MDEPGKRILSASVDRRQTLSGVAGAALGSLATASAAQTAIGQPMPGGATLPDDPDSRMRWAIVGLGSFAIGQVIPGFADAKHSRITAFVSGNPDKARKLGASYAVDRFYD